jgi:hypothetical protein
VAGAGDGGITPGWSTAGEGRSGGPNEGKSAPGALRGGLDGRGGVEGGTVRGNSGYGGSGAGGAEGDAARGESWAASRKRKSPGAESGADLGAGRGGDTVWEQPESQGFAGRPRSGRRVTGSQMEDVSHRFGVEEATSSEIAGLSGGDEYAAGTFSHEGGHASEGLEEASPNGQAPFRENGTSGVSLRGGQMGSVNGVGFRPDAASSAQGSSTHTRGGERPQVSISCTLSCIPCPFPLQKLLARLFLKGSSAS